METEPNDKLAARIREFLSTRESSDPVTDLLDIPGDIFALAEPDEYYIGINSRIKQLTTIQQKILLYVCQGHDPGLISESLELDSPEAFWLERKVILDIMASDSFLSGDEVPDEQLRSDILHVFRVNGDILGRFQEISDELEKEREKHKSRLRIRWSVVIVPVILLLLFLFIYPLLVKPDPVNLFEQYKNSCIPDLQQIDTTLFWPGQFYEACVLFNSESYSEAESLLGEITREGADFLSESRWMMVLIYLNRGLGKSSRNQLNMIRRTDPDFYQKCCRKLAWDIRKL